MDISEYINFFAIFNPSERAKHEKSTENQNCWYHAQVWSQAYKIAVVLYVVHLFLRHGGDFFTETRCHSLLHTKSLVLWDKIVGHLICTFISENQGVNSIYQLLLFLFHLFSLTHFLLLCLYNSCPWLIEFQKLSNKNLQKKN